MRVMPRLVVGCLVVVCLSASSVGASSASGIETEARGLLKEELATFIKIAAMGVSGDKQPGAGDACFNSTFSTLCFDATGRLTVNSEHGDADKQRYFWDTKTSSRGHAVYQPKDDGRVFFMHRTDDGLMFWVVYDPKGRDLSGWLKGQGFSEVGSYNAKFAYAGRIQDVQKRREFWIWLQAREYRMKEFEKKYPSLATSVPLNNG